MKQQSKKGQAAMEFLVTYGWMIMIVIISGATLAYFGIFNPEPFLPELCTFNNDFQCTQSIIKTNGTVMAKITNHYGKLITLSRIACSAQGESAIIESTITKTWNPAESIQLSCDLPTTFVEGGHETVIMEFDYKAKNSFKNTARGSVQGKAALS